MFAFILMLALGQAQTVAPPTVGVIADDLVDYSQWAAGYKELWTGKEVTRVLAGQGVRPVLMTAADLGDLKKFDAVLIATDHTYPERGPWGGPVAKALVEYVRGGGIYCMPIGVPHYTSKNIEAGGLDTGHWEDFFGLKGTIVSGGRSPLMLTKQGSELGLPDPANVNARPARQLSFEKSAVLVWTGDYVPCLSVAPYGKGWLVHWGAGPEGGMDASVRDFLLAAQAKVILAAKAGRLRPQTRKELMAAEGVTGKSLDDLDREAFRPGPGPFDDATPVIPLQAMDAEPGELHRVRGASVPPHCLPLDGDWLMQGFPKGQGDERRLTASGQPWTDALAANVPCSVQTALFAAGRIPDPTVAFNDRIARTEVANKEWWFRKDFDWKPSGATRLVFDGVDYSATFWLNGVRLGEHEGPFGGPVYDVTGLVREQNTLVVRVDPLPPDWKLVFKFNCVYGWHYVDCPPIGIWQSVRVEQVPLVELVEMFVAATDAARGQIDVEAVLRGPAGGFSANLEIWVDPANFKGPAHEALIAVESQQAQKRLHLRFQVPDAHLWWPVDLGSPDLYRLTIGVGVGEKVGGTVTLDRRSTRFGIRTIRMAPVQDQEPSPERYNWTFVINGRPSFLKGCNWATMDAFLRLDAARYRRFLTLAKDEHIQIMRSWGGGLLETDTFYDLCDELGIMVLQEFPLTWQNFDAIRQAVADETAERNVKRLRNHPSLAMWCGGNEHQGTGALIELLGRRCLELDGTRPYHRTDPFGGSVHNYDVYWGKGPFEKYIELVPPRGKPGPVAIGETGLASPCAVESTLRFLPEAEKSVWPPPDAGSFVHHTPTFTPDNMGFLNRHAQELDPCKDLAGFTRGAQLAQALGLRTACERMRARWPDSTAMIFYKLTDVYPGCSWSTIDYYGVPKMAHYFVRSAYAPVHVCLLHENYDAQPGGELTLRPVVLDDAGALRRPVQVNVRLYDARLREVTSRQAAVEGAPMAVRELAEMKLPVPQAEAAPLLVVADLASAEGRLDRAHYWFNFRARPGCLFTLPQTKLAARRDGGEVVIENVGQRPAVGVWLDDPACSDSLRAADGYFWLEAGEKRRIAVEMMPNIVGQVHEPQTLKAAAWNADPVAVE